MSAALPEEMLDLASSYVGAHLGLYFPVERRSSLQRGLERAAVDFGFPDISSCVRWLLLSPLSRTQIEVLASHLTVGETYFFRDKKLFGLLENSILPEMIRKRRENGRRLRIWSAGCATGEEPYSIAILLGKLIRDLDDWNITLLATDINPMVLDKAAKGLYGNWSFRDVPSPVKERYFTKTGQGRYFLHPEFRKLVTFAYHNLILDPYPSLTNNTNAMDVILCRNVLMYFAPDQQKEVVRGLSRCLVEGGLLILTPAEGSDALCRPLVPLRLPGVVVYQKDSLAPMAPMVQEAPAFWPATRREPSRQPFRFPALPLFPEKEKIEKPPVEIQEAEPANRAVPQEEPAPPSDPYRKALAAYEKGLHDIAETEITAFLAGNRASADALALLARIRANRGQLAEARELCARAITLAKLNPALHYLLGMILQELGQTEESIAAFKRALYLDQNFVLAHFALGTVARRRGKNREAARYFANARAALREYGPDDPLPESEGVTAGRMEEIIDSASSKERVIP